MLIPEQLAPNYCTVLCLLIRLNAQAGSSDCEKTQELPSVKKRGGFLTTPPNQKSPPPTSQNQLHNSQPKTHKAKESTEICCRIFITASRLRAHINNPNHRAVNLPPPRIHHHHYHCPHSIRPTPPAAPAARAASAPKRLPRPHRTL